MVCALRVLRMWKDRCKKSDIREGCKIKRLLNNGKEYI